MAFKALYPIAHYGGGHSQAASGRAEAAELNHADEYEDVLQRRHEPGFLEWF
jgi:nanoRNase/pAp phosphatase (c-di-AMP/oligoRNAs hydrolase)